MSTLEQFGTVDSLKTKNKYVGTVHVVLADHDSLRKAEAASLGLIEGVQQVW